MVGRSRPGRWSARTPVSSAPGGRGRAAPGARRLTVSGRRPREPGCGRQREVGAMDCSITQRCTPRPEPCSVPRAGDHGSDPGLADLPAVFVVVIAAVSAERIRALPWPAAAAADRRDGRDQGHELGDVVAVAAGQGRRQRDPVRFSDHVVLRARPGTVDRARARFGPPFKARTCELSITALDQSSAPAAFSSASSSSCSCCHTPASCQSPQPPPARHPGPEPQLLRQELPRDPRVQHEQDAGQPVSRGRGRG